MEQLDELNEKLNREFLAAVRAEDGETIHFTNSEESGTRYAKLSEEEGYMEKQVREERAKSASRPVVYLTF
jgi:hypothetical protein